MLSLIRIYNLIRAALFVSISSLLLCCNKNKANSEIEDVTGFMWRVYRVQNTNDNFISPVPTDWEFNLNSDRRFSFKLGNAMCSGTYSWTAIDSTSADVGFAINEWNNPGQSAEIAMKLKSIVGSINKCFFYKPPYSGQYPPPSFATRVLQFEGTAGFFYVYR